MGRSRARKPWMERDRVAPGNGPGWITSDAVTAPGGYLIASTTVSSSPKPAPSPPSSANTPPASDFDLAPWTPQATAPNAGSYGTSSNTDVQEDVSVPGPGDPPFSPRIDDTTNPVLPFSNPQSQAPPTVILERGRPDLSEQGPSQSTTVGVLGGSNPGSPQVTASNGTNTASATVGGPLALAGNAPVQSNALLDASIVNDDHLTTTTGFVDGLIGAGDAQSGRDIRPSAHRAIPSVVYRAAHRPISDSANGTSEGPREPIPSPLGADLIVEALPMVRESLETALDQFVRQLDHLDVSLLNTPAPTPIVVFCLTLLSTAASAEMARRYVRRKTSLKRGILAVDPSGRQLTLGFPELPGSWSERRP